MFQVVVYILCLVVIIKSFFNLYFLHEVVSWFSTTKNDEPSTDRVKDSSIFFILPVYLEQDNIRKAISYYSNIITANKKACLVVVTTKKEDPRDKNVVYSKTTYDVAKKYILSKRYTNVILLKYPKNKGYMAHQVNFAFNYCKSKFISRDNWMFLLNIDSLYSKEGISDIFKTASLGKKRVYQYSALFLRNFNGFFNNKNILKAAALYQTRWTFVHELKRYVFNTKPGLCMKYQLAHAVGHGLLIPFSVFEKIPFDEEYIVEDSVLGFSIRACGYSIWPRKIFEIGDSPDCVSGLLKQQYVWSFGPTGYFLYWKKFKKIFRNEYNKNHKTILLLTIQGCASAINWQVSSWVFFIIALGFFVGHISFILLILIFLLYSLDYLIVLFWLKKQKYINFSYLWLLSLIPNLWIVILLHSIPANIATIHLLLSKVGVKKIKKNKTSHKI